MALPPPPAPGGGVSPGALPPEASDRDFLIGPTPSPELPRTDSPASPRRSAPGMAPPAVRIPPREAQIGPDPAGETQRRITGEGALRDAAAEYVAGGNAPTVAEEMALYADTVDYYGQGAKNRVEIRADLAGERKKWPSRRFQISRIIRTDYDPVLDRGSIVFRYQYELANGAKRRSGEAESTIVFRSVSKGPEVVLVKEHTVP